MTAQTILPANTLSGGYDVANSARFDNNAYMSQTWGSSGNRRTWTLSMWIKYSGLNNCRLFSIGDDASNTILDFFITSGVLRVQDTQSGSETLEFRTTQVFRDPSAWSHLVFACDTTQGTEANRFKIYHNGTQITSFSTETYPDQNLQSLMNHTTGAATVGARAVSQSGTEFDGYMAEVVVLDGTAAAPTSFGEFDSDSGIWKPIDVSGLTAGTNGFYLDFEDSGNLGNDAFGGSDFSETNFAATDQSTDTCTNNFCTMNINDNAEGGGTFAEGNLQVTSRNTGYSYNTGTFGVAAGKWYWEVKWSAQDTGSTNQVLIGVAKRPSSSTTNYLGVTAWGYGYQGSNGHVLLSNSNLIGYASYSVGDIVGVALDMDNNRLYFSKNGTFNNSSNPANGTNPISITAADSVDGDSGFYFPAFGDGNNNLVETGQFNFGSPVHSISSGNADANGHGNFEYAVPSGYLALNSKNLAESGG